MKRCMLFLMLLCITLTGCAGQETHGDPLWIVTELSTSDGMNYQLEQAMAQLQEEYPDVTFQVDYLPQEQEERSLYFQYLRPRILAGNGPDIYLLPTGSVQRIDGASKNGTPLISVEPLFSDVTQAMYMGLFADISQYYDADTELNPQSLQPDVMAAGTVENARYVLPLRYTMPLLFTDPDISEAMGYDEALLNSGIANLMTDALRRQDAMMALGLRMPEDLSLLPRLFDYETGEILVTRETIAEYMRLYQQAQSLTGNRAFPDQVEEAVYRQIAALEEQTIESVKGLWQLDFDLDSFNHCRQYYCYDINWKDSGFPLFTDDLAGLLDFVTINKGRGDDQQVRPLARMDGTTGAEITYFAAVGGSCDTPELAYRLIRRFLTEEYQLDGVRPRTDRSHDIPSLLKYAPELQNYGLVENSWAVRMDGSLEAYRDTFVYRTVYLKGGIITRSRTRMYQIRVKQLNLSDADAEVLRMPIDEVRFPIYMDGEYAFANVLATLNQADGTPNQVDIDALADRVWTELWWHLAEG